MTTTTPEAAQLAADYANAAAKAVGLPADWRGKDFEHLCALTNLATDFLALKADFLALKAKAEKLEADMARIDRIADDYGWASASSAETAREVARIAASHRPKPVDPLVEAIIASMKAAGMADPTTSDAIEMARQLRAELAKHGEKLGEV